MTGFWDGFDYELSKSIVENVNVPVITNGGCGSLKDIDKALNECGVQAVGVGSLVVYQKKGMGVLVNFPDKALLKQIIE